MNALIQSIKINNCSYAKEREKKDCNLYGGCKLFLSKNWFEVMRVDYGIASISLFRVYVLPSNMSI